MQAETAYNVIQTLPETEKMRLYAMLKLKDVETKKPEARTSGHTRKITPLKS